jgi:ribosomal protein L40E
MTYAKAKRLVLALQWAVCLHCDQRVLAASKNDLFFVICRRCAARIRPPVYL